MFYEVGSGPRKCLIQGYVSKELSEAIDDFLNKQPIKPSRSSFVEAASLFYLKKYDK